MPGPSCGDRSHATIVGQGAVLIAAAILLLAASVLFVGVGAVREPQPAFSVVALLNAAMFYLWGMGAISHVIRTWRRAKRLE